MKNGIFISNLALPSCVPSEVFTADRALKHEASSFCRWSLAVWGGDPVCPTINYIQDPNEIIDHRGPDFHGPTPDMLSYLKECSKIIFRDELEKILAKEKMEQLEVFSLLHSFMPNGILMTISYAYWAASISFSQTLGYLYKARPKKEGKTTLEEAIEDSKNLTDFLMAFDEE